MKKKDNIIDIGDNKSINFNDSIDFSKGIIDGKINNFNKEKKYNEKFKDIGKNLENKKKDTNDIKLYIFYLNKLKRILFTPKKSSDTPTKIPRLVRKKDDKAKTFDLKDSLPKYNEKSNRLKNLEEEYQNIAKKKIMKNSDFYEYELNISDPKINYFDKIIKENPKMSAKKIDIINQLKSLYTIRKNYFKIKINDPKIKTPFLLLDDQIHKLDDEFRDQKGSRTFTYQNKFVKLLTLLTQLFTKNNSKKLKDDVNQILKELYNSKQITKQVYNILNKSILYKIDSQRTK